MNFEEGGSVIVRMIDGDPDALLTNVLSGNYTLTSPDRMTVSFSERARERYRYSISNDLLRLEHLDYSVTNELRRIAHWTIPPKPGLSDNGQLKTVMHRIQAGVPDTNGWYVAESTGGNFTVRIPAPFNDFMVTGIDEHGKTVRYSTVGTLTKNMTKYSATLLPGKADKPSDQYFDEFVGDFRKKKTLTNTRHFTFKNLPALEITVGDSKRSAQMRVILSGRDVYTLIVEYDTQSEGELKNVIATFFASLQCSPNK